MPNKVELIKGNNFTDPRGSLSFVNQFNFNNVVRFYHIEQTNTLTVRAWQGHKIEQKYFYVAKGAFFIATVLIDDWDHPSINLTPDTYLLTQKEPAILSIPAGYANGIKAILAESILIVFSSLTLEESELDRYSFNPSLWLEWASVGEGIRPETKMTQKNR